MKRQSKTLGKLIISSQKSGSISEEEKQRVVVCRSQCACSVAWCDFAVDAANSCFREAVRIVPSALGKALKKRVFWSIFDFSESGVILVVLGVIRVSCAEWVYSSR